MAQSKKKARKVIKVFLPVADRLFSYGRIKNPTLRLTNKIQQRYAKHGESVDSTIPRLYKGPWRFILDTPKISKSPIKKIYVSGWFVPIAIDGAVSMQLKTPSGNFKKITYGINRSDVAAILRTRYRQKKSDKCGFGSTISIDEDGSYTLEVKIGGSEWQKICRFTLEYDLDLLAKDAYNPALSNNMAEHLTLIETKKRYFYEDELKSTYKLDTKKDPKLVAFYLPQFHPIKVNDEAWGKGY